MGTETVSGRPAADDLRTRAEAVQWYHSIELAPGWVTPGFFDHRPLVDRYGLPDDLSGKRAIDIGAQDGFWAFELERRGAEVVALDLDQPEKLDWPRHLAPAGVKRQAGGFPLADDSAFAIAADALGSGVTREPLSVYEATPERLGQFDLVFAGSMHVHLRDPVLALERMADLCRGQLVFADARSRRLDWIPFLKLAQFSGESPWMTWWIPTSRTTVSMIRCAGFRDVRIHTRFTLPFQHEKGGVPHVVVHAAGPG